MYRTMRAVDEKEHRAARCPLLAVLQMAGAAPSRTPHSWRVLGRIQGAAPVKMGGTNEVGWE